MGIERKLFSILSTCHSVSVCDQRNVWTKFRENISILTRVIVYMDRRQGKMDSFCHSEKFYNIWSNWLGNYVHYTQTLILILKKEFNKKKCINHPLRNFPNCFCHWSWVKTCTNIFTFCYTWVCLYVHILFVKIFI